MKSVDIDQTRTEIRNTMRLWDIDPSELEISWQEDRNNPRARLPGAVVRYLRNGKWQTVSCYQFSTRPENLRQIFLLLERLRIAEQHGVQYEGLASTKEVVVASGSGVETQRKQLLLDAFDFMGVSPDDPTQLIRDVYRKKTMYYHPDKVGGNEEKFKRLQMAYEAIMESRGEAP